MVFVGTLYRDTTHTGNQLPPPRPQRSLCNVKGRFRVGPHCPHCQSRISRIICARSSDQAPTPAPAHATTCFSTLYATGGGRAALAPGGAVGLRFGLRRPNSFSAGAIETPYYPFSRNVNPAFATIRLTQGRRRGRPRPTIQSHYSAVVFLGYEQTLRARV